MRRVYYLCSSMGGDGALHSLVLFPPATLPPPSTLAPPPCTLTEAGARPAGAPLTIPPPPPLPFPPPLFTLTEAGARPAGAPRCARLRSDARRVRRIPRGEDLQFNRLLLPSPQLPRCFNFTGIHSIERRGGAGGGGAGGGGTHHLCPPPTLPLHSLPSPSSGLAGLRSVAF